ncbi:MAG: matrixin family metalloprotease [Rhodocyclaceae bacterium]|nr:matrixin family metalloprotease [Rhodocyclaceae bacterium]
MKRLLATLVAIFSLAAPLTASAYVLSPTSPGKWGSPVMGTGATVTWSLMPTGSSCAQEFAGCTMTSFADAMPAGWLNAVNTAFNMWSSVANLTFVQVPDDGAAFNAPTASGDIRLGLHTFDGAFGILAHGYYPPLNGGSAAGDIHFDVAENWKVSFGGPGFDIVQVLAHELGHALGLDHTNVPGSLMNPFYSESFYGPQADDIAGMQHIYGRPVAQVPEPGVLALVAIALLGLMLSRRRTHS